MLTAPDTCPPALRARLDRLYTERTEIGRKAARGSFDAKLDLEQNGRDIDAALDEWLASRRSG